MLRRSKLTLRVTEAASAVCGITFHPNGMDGGLTTVTLTLLPYTTLSRLTGLSGVGAMRLPTFTISLSVQKHSHLPITEMCSCWVGSKQIKMLTCLDLQVSPQVGLYLK